MIQSLLSQNSIHNAPTCYSPGTVLVLADTWEIDLVLMFTNMHGWGVGAEENPCKNTDVEELPPER